MAVIAPCKYCGEKISIRKMPAGHHVPFDFKTNDYHECSGSKKATNNKEISIKDKKEIKSKKSIKEKITKNIEQDFDQSEEFDAYEETSSEDVFKEDTVESLRKEINIETSEKKNNKPIIYGAIALAVIIVLVLMG